MAGRDWGEHFRCSNLSRIGLSARVSRGRYLRWAAMRDVIGQVVREGRYLAGEEGNGCLMNHVVSFHLLRRFVVAEAM
jgi:hypothetical protein